MNKIHKLLLGASIVGAMYLTGCKQDANPYVSQDGLVSVEKDSTQVIKSVSMDLIQLEPTKMTWSNSKLVGKDEGTVTYEVGSGDNRAGYTYSYSKCLFKGPDNTEVSLFSKEETLYVGQNYNIEFYLLKPGQNISSGMILEALENKDFDVKNDKPVRDLEGVLNSYSRVTK